MSIEDIKRHGAIIGLESEISHRMQLMRDALDKKEWTTFYSHAVYAGECSEELRKLMEKEKGKQ